MNAFTECVPICAILYKHMKENSKSWHSVCLCHVHARVCLYSCFYIGTYHFCNFALRTEWKSVGQLLLFSWSLHSISIRMYSRLHKSCPNVQEGQAENLGMNDSSLTGNHRLSIRLSNKLGMRIIEIYAGGVQVIRNFCLFYVTGPSILCVIIEIHANNSEHVSVYSCARKSALFSLEIMLEDSTNHVYTIV
jgi:hypothetical protein